MKEITKVRSPKSAVFILLRPWTSVQNTAYRHSLHISIQLLWPGPRGNPGAAWVWGSPLPLPQTPPAASVLTQFYSKQSMYTVTQLPAVLDSRGEPPETGEELAVKPLSSRQEPISSQGQPAITPATNLTLSLTQVKRVIQGGERTEMFIRPGVVTSTYSLLLQKSTGGFREKSQGDHRGQ